MSVQPKRTITPEEYLEIERAASFKSEYYAGEMFAMAGTSSNHSSIIVNLVSVLRPQVRQTKCKVFVTDLRLHVPDSGLFTYTDVMVVCNPRYHDNQKDMLLNPSIIVEILSPSTEAYDRGQKFLFYRRIESLQHYLLVSQDERRVEKFSKNVEGNWVLTEFADDESSISIAVPELAIALDLPLREIYEDVFQLEV
jgi:Uma2 family endonuclease